MNEFVYWHLNLFVMLPLSDSIWETGESVEYLGEEYPGWVKSFYADEPCKFRWDYIFYALGGALAYRMKL